MNKIPLWEPLFEVSPHICRWIHIYYTLCNRTRNRIHQPRMNKIIVTLPQIKIWVKAIRHRNASINEVNLVLTANGSSHHTGPWMIIGTIKRSINEYCSGILSWIHIIGAILVLKGIHLSVYRCTMIAWASIVVLIVTNRDWRWRSRCAAELQLELWYHTSKLRTKWRREIESDNSDISHKMTWHQKRIQYWLITKSTYQS